MNTKPNPKTVTAAGLAMSGIDLGLLPPLANEALRTNPQLVMEAMALSEACRPDANRPEVAAQDLTSGNGRGPRGAAKDLRVTPKNSATTSKAAIGTSKNPTNNVATAISKNPTNNVATAISKNPTNNVATAISKNPTNNVATAISKNPTNNVATGTPKRSTTSKASGTPKSATTPRASIDAPKRSPRTSKPSNDSAKRSVTTSKVVIATAKHRSSNTKHPRATAPSDQKRIKALEGTLKRKEVALAETVALLVLRKKAVALWGEEGAE